MALFFLQRGSNFTQLYGFNSDDDNFTNYFINTVLPKAGIERGKYHLHSFRHTTATLLLKAGYSMKQIQEMLGHSTITTTMDIYTNVDSVLEQAAAIDLDKVLFG